MNKLVAAVLITALFLAGCNLPTRSISSTPTGDPVATQVSLLLTQAPSATALPAVTATTVTVPTRSVTLLPSSTAIPTATVAVIDTQAPPSPTPPAGDPKNSLGAPTWYSTLDNSKAFYLYDNENTRVAMENGSLLLTGVNANGWLGWSLTYSHPAQNFYLEGLFSPQACSGADLYGLVFRSTNNESGYFFGMTCDGRYNLHARNFSDGSDKVLVDLTANSAIQTGSNSVNRVGVMVNGDRIRLYANGILLQEVTDDTYKDKGNFGAIVAANNTDGFTVKMDEISLWIQP